MEIRSRKEYSPVVFFSVVWHALAYLCLGNLINQSPSQFIGLLNFSLERAPPPTSLSHFDLWVFASVVSFLLNHLHLFCPPKPHSVKAHVHGGLCDTLGPSL